MKVAFISSDFSATLLGMKIGGAGYYRCQLPAEMLRRNGIEAQVFWTARQLVTGEIIPMQDAHTPADNGWDVIVMQRWMWPEMADIVRHAVSFGQTIVQDVDDHFWSLHHSNAASRALSADNIAAYADVLRASSLVTVSTPFLAQVVHQLGCDNISVLRNMIDLQQWERQSVSDEVRTVGWVGSTAHRSHDLEQIGNALRVYLKHHPSVRFVHGGMQRGTDRVHSVVGIPASRVDERPVVPIKKYPMLWNGIDIALCPLNPIDFNRAKSAIKAMEASAAGVPYIASMLNEYEWFGQGVTVACESDWRTALDRLTSDRSLRQELADLAHDRVVLEDSSVRWKDWAEVYA